MYAQNDMARSPNLMRFLSIIAHKVLSTMSDTW